MVSMRRFIIALATLALFSGPAFGDSAIFNPSGSSGGVTSLAGTANQIDASAATGAVTISLDPVIVAPGSVAAGGTNGLGFFELQTQASAPSAAPTNGIRLNASGVGNLAVRGSSGFAAQFVISGLTSSKTFTLPDASGTFAITGNNLSVFAATTSAQLAGIISDETGSGPLVFATAPSLSSLTVTTAFTATGLVTNADLVNASTTVNGQACTLGSTCTVTATASAITVGTTTIGSGTTTRILYDNAGTLDEYVVSGSGSVCMTTSCVMTTPNLGTPSAVALTNATLIPAGQLTGSIADARLSANVPLLNASNTYTGATQIISAASAAGPDWQAGLTGDTVQRAAFGLDTSNTPRISFGPGGSTARNAMMAYLGAQNLRFGTNPSATPASYTLTIGEASRPGTDTNIGGGSTTIQPGLGTGTGALPSIIFQIPTLTGSGSGAQSYATVGTITSTGFQGALGATTPNTIVGTTLSVGTSNPFTVSSTGATVIANATASTTSGTGALIVTGGVGIGGAAYVAGRIRSADFIEVTSGTGGGFFTTSSSVLQMPANGSFKFSNNAITNSFMLSAPTATATPTIQFGAADVDTGPIAQTLRFQGPLVGGTSNVAGPNTTIIGTLGKGNANSGDIIIQTGGAIGASGTTIATATTALTIKGVTQNVQIAAQLVVANMTQTSAAQSGTVCWAAGGLTYDATLGCLASLPELKDFHGQITDVWNNIEKIRPYWASWKKGSPEWKGGDHAVQPVFNAREIAAISGVGERLTAKGPDGKLRGVRYMEMTAYLQAEIIALKVANESLRAANDNDHRDISILKANFERFERSLRTKQARN